MTLEPLHSPFVGISMYQDDYSKVRGLLPTPSYTDTLYSRYNQKIILIYAIEGHITSPSQYRWISNIKLGLQEFLCVPFTYEDEFYITDTTDITNNIYTIDELSRAFKASLVTYPKIMYPATKKELYKHLCWYGKRLIHQKCFTKEAMTSTALLMNKKLEEKYKDKELYKKALGAYMFMGDNQDKCKVKLDEVQLKKAHSKGATIKNKNQRENTKEKIAELVKSGDYTKPNGKANLSLLAEAMNMTRQTIAKYV